MISGLLEAILLLKQISVCNCATHTSSEDLISRDNVRADVAAKVVTRLAVNVKHETTDLVTFCCFSSFVIPEEKNLWTQNN